MRPSTARALAAAALVAAAALALSVGATPETACAAAAARDRRVDYGFCVSRLSHHHDSPDADTWGLAKVAADVGVATAGDAVYDIKALLATNPPGDAQARAVLEQCQRLYDAAESAFAEAYDAINRRDYAAGKGKAAEAASLARRCDDAFARAALRPPPQVARWGEESAKIAVVCTAITDLID
jgi:pectinesterase inhibitor-like protein